jgi:hypothetical protein
VITERRNGNEFNRASQFIRLNKINQHNFAKDNTFNMIKNTNKTLQEIAPLTPPQK